MSKPVTKGADPILAKLLGEVTKVPGVAAVGLGGSRSIGTANPTSDYDVIMFMEKDGDIAADAVAGAIATFGGSWNGDMTRPLAELSVDGRKVELFFRSMARIADEIALAREGKFRRQMNPLHTIGFLTTIVVSYATYVRPLWDPRGKLKALIDSAHPYPDVLRNAMVNTFRTEAKLALIHAGKVNNVTDVGHLLGLYARTVAAWSLILFAVNRRYPIIDKGGRQVVAALPKCPRSYDFRTQAIFRAAAAGDLKGANAEANRLHEEVIALAEEKGPAQQGATAS